MVPHSPDIAPSPGWSRVIEQERDRAFAEKAAKKAEKKAEKAMKKAEKKAEKAMKKAEKKAEKARKKVEKKAEKAAKKAEKEAKKTFKDLSTSAAGTVKTIDASSSAPTTEASYAAMPVGVVLAVCASLLICIGSAWLYRRHQSGTTK